MSKVRVLVVDDSVVVRRMLAKLIGEDEGIDVIGTAPNGPIALSKIAQSHPDLITLDVEMPGMNGLQTLAAIRQAEPTLPVIMVSRFVGGGSAQTIDSIALGANDYVVLPDRTGVESNGMSCVREQLIPKIRRLTSTKRKAEFSAIRPARTSQGISNASRAASPIDLVVIGSSTGGPNALGEIFACLPGDFPVPIVIAQHMPPVFTAHLARRLSAQGSIFVEEGRTGTLLEAGRAWIAPGDYHLTIVRDRVSLRLATNQGPPENSCRPAVDVLLRSAVQAVGSGVLAVILTGMGYDGLRSCKEVRSAGGQIIAQDEATSVVWGMPGAVAQAGIADAVLPIQRIAAEILLRVRKCE